MKTTLHDGPKTYLIEIFHPDRELPAARLSDLERLRQAWVHAENRRGKPNHQWSGEDFGIAHRLVGKYRVDNELVPALEWFYRLHGEELLTYPHPMRLFASRLPTLLSEMSGWTRRKR